jgi:hypothetical protein
MVKGLESDGKKDREVAAIFARLGESQFRRRFHLSPKDRDYLKSKGLGVVLQHAADFI